MPHMKNVLEKLKALEKSRLTRLGVKLLLVLITFWILIWPHLKRPENLLLSGKESYYHLQNGTLAIILSFLNKYLNTDIILLAKLVPIILGVLTMLLFFVVLKRLKLDYGIVILTTLILISSPSFVYLFGTLTAFSFTSFLFILSLYLFLKKKELLGVLVLYLIPFFGITSTLLGLLLVLIYSLKNQRFRLFLGALPSLALLYFSPIIFLPLYTRSSVISDFGGHYGLGLFILLLSVFGLTFLWQKKYKYISVYVVILSLLVFSSLDIRILAYFNFIFVSLAALGLMNLMRREWRSKQIKQLAILIMVYGLIFSGLSYISSVSLDLPNEEVIEMIDYMETIPEGNVFSQTSRKPWIEYSGKNFVTEENLFYTQDLEQAMAIIDAKKIEYLWIDKEMEEKIWKGEEKELLFLLEYSENFKKNKVNDYVVLWEVVEQEIFEESQN